MRVRGLKRINTLKWIIASRSHPMRVRGLKPSLKAAFALQKCRTPCGCVD